MRTMIELASSEREVLIDITTTSQTLLRPGHRWSVRLRRGLLCRARLA
jgi:hypothetical protein